MSFFFSLFRLVCLVATSQFQSDSSINTIKITAKKISVSRQRQNLLLNRSLLSVRPVRKFAHLIEFSSTVLLAPMVPQGNWYLAKKKKEDTNVIFPPILFFPKDSIWATADRREMVFVYISSSSSSPSNILWKWRNSMRNSHKGLLSNGIVFILCLAV